MLDDLDDVRFRELVLFDRVVQLGTITAAARELGLPKPTASRWLALLEQHVGQPLVHRGARSVQLTERGRALHALLPPLLAGVRAVRAQVAADVPGGVLRVSVPVPLGRLVGGRVIARFRHQLPAVRLEIALSNERVDLQLPAVRLEIALSNERVDLLRDRFDLAIRGGRLPDSSLIARKLAVVPLWLYASPRYRDAVDVPFIAAPGDQARHDAEPAVVVDDRTAVCDALVAGAGMGILPAFLGEPARQEGQLVRVGAAPLAALPVHAVFLPEQRGDARVRALVEIIRERVQDWSVPAGAASTNRPA